MRDQIEGTLVNFSSFDWVTGSCLLEDGVVKPKVDVTFPEAFLRHGRYIDDSSFKDVSRACKIHC